MFCGKGKLEVYLIIMAFNLFIIHVFNNDFVVIKNRAKIAWHCLHLDQ